MSSFFQRLGAAFRSLSPLENPTIPLSSPEAWRWVSGGSVSDSGELVDDATALSIATVFASVRVLSESVASLPLRLYRKTPQGRIEAIDHPLHYLLSVAPNDETTAFTLWEVVVKSLALTGNAYVEIERDGAGNPTGLWPLNPRQTRPIRLSSGRLAYETSDGTPSSDQRRTILSQNLLHVPLFPSFDGITGLSPLDLARQTLGEAISVQKLGARFFRNFSTPSVAIELAEQVDSKTKDLMRDQWEQLQSGSNSHRVAILDQGATVKPISISPEQAQFLETRRFTREQVAALYRVPVHMVGDNQKLSNASAEQLNLSFIVDSLRPYLSRIEAEIVRKLLKPQPGQPAEFMAQFDVSERLRGDTAAATTYYRTAIQFGWMNPNEVRRVEGMNIGPDALNAYLSPVNMQNSNKLLDAEQPASSEQ